MSEVDNDGGGGDGTPVPPPPPGQINYKRRLYLLMTDEELNDYDDAIRLMTQDTVWEYDVDDRGGNLNLMQSVRFQSLLYGYPRRRATSGGVFRRVIAAFWVDEGPMDNYDESVIDRTNSGLSYSQLMPVENFLGDGGILEDLDSPELLRWAKMVVADAKTKLADPRLRLRREPVTLPMITSDAPTKGSTYVPELYTVDAAEAIPMSAGMVRQTFVFTPKRPEYRCDVMYYIEKIHAVGGRVVQENASARFERFTTSLLTMAQVGKPEDYHIVLDVVADPSTMLAYKKTLFVDQYWNLEFRSFRQWMREKVDSGQYNHTPSLKQALLKKMQRFISAQRLSAPGLGLPIYYEPVDVEKIPILDGGVRPLNVATETILYGLVPADMDNRSAKLLASTMIEAYKKMTRDMEFRVKIWVQTFPFYDGRWKFMFVVTQGPDPQASRNLAKYVNDKLGPDQLVTYGQARTMFYRKFDDAIEDLGRRKFYDNQLEQFMEHSTRPVELLQTMISNKPVIILDQPNPTPPPAADLGAGSGSEVALAPKRKRESDTGDSDPKRVKVDPADVEEPRRVIHVLSYTFDPVRNVHNALEDTLRTYNSTVEADDEKLHFAVQNYASSLKIQLTTAVFAGPTADVGEEMVRTEVSQYDRELMGYPVIVTEDTVRDVIEKRVRGLFPRHLKKEGGDTEWAMRATLIDMIENHMDSGEYDDTILNAQLLDTLVPLPWDDLTTRRTKKDIRASRVPISAEQYQGFLEQFRKNRDAMYAKYGEMGERVFRRANTVAQIIPVGIGPLVNPTKTWRDEEWKTARVAHPSRTGVSPAEAGTKRKQAEVDLDPQDKGKEKRVKREGETPSDELPRRLFAVVDIKKGVVPTNYPAGLRRMKMCREEVEKLFGVKFSRFEVSRMLHKNVPTRITVVDCQGSLDMINMFLQAMEPHVILPLTDVVTSLVEMSSSYLVPDRPFIWIWWIKFKKLAEIATYTVLWTPGMMNRTWIENQVKPFITKWSLKKGGLPVAMGVRLYAPRQVPGAGGSVYRVRVPLAVIILEGVKTDIERCVDELQHSALGETRSGGFMPVQVQSEWLEILMRTGSVKSRPSLGKEYDQAMARVQGWFDGLVKVDSVRRLPVAADRYDLKTGRSILNELAAAALHGQAHGRGFYEVPEDIAADAAAAAHGILIPDRVFDNIIDRYRAVYLRRGVRELYVTFMSCLKHMYGAPAYPRFVPRLKGDPLDRSTVRPIYTMHDPAFVETEQEGALPVVEEEGSTGAGSMVMSEGKRKDRPFISGDEGGGKFMKVEGKGKAKASAGVDYVHVDDSLPPVPPAPARSTTPKWDTLRIVWNPSQNNARGLYPLDLALEYFQKEKGYEYELFMAHDLMFLRSAGLNDSDLRIIRLNVRNTPLVVTIEQLFDMYDVNNIFSDNQIDFFESRKGELFMGNEVRVRAADEELDVYVVRLDPVESMRDVMSETRRHLADFKRALPSVPVEVKHMMMHSDLEQGEGVYVYLACSESTVQFLEKVYSNRPLGGVFDLYSGASLNDRRLIATEYAWKALKGRNIPLIPQNAPSTLAFRWMVVYKPLASMALSKYPTVWELDTVAQIVNQVKTENPDHVLWSLARDTRTSAIPHPGSLVVSAVVVVLGLCDAFETIMQRINDHPHLAAINNMIGSIMPQVGGNDNEMTRSLMKASAVAEFAQTYPSFSWMDKGKEKAVTTDDRMDVAEGKRKDRPFASGDEGGGKRMKVEEKAGADPAFDWVPVVDAQPEPSPAPLPPPEQWDLVFVVWDNSYFSPEERLRRLDLNLQHETARQGSPIGVMQYELWNHEGLTFTRVANASVNDLLDALEDMDSEVLVTPLEEAATALDFAGNRKWTDEQLDYLESRKDDAEIGDATKVNASDLATESYVFTLNQREPRDDPYADAKRMVQTIKRSHRKEEVVMHHALSRQWVTDHREPTLYIILSCSYLVKEALSDYTADWILPEYSFYTDVRTDDAGTSYDNGLAKAWLHFRGTNLPVPRQGDPSMAFRGMVVYGEYVDNQPIALTDWYSAARPILLSPSDNPKDEVWRTDVVLKMKRDWHHEHDVMFYVMFSTCDVFERTKQQLNQAEGVAAISDIDDDVSLFSRNKELTARALKYRMAFVDFARTYVERHRGDVVEEVDVRTVTTDDRMDVAEARWSNPGEAHPSGGGGGHAINQTVVLVVDGYTGTEAKEFATDMKLGLEQVRGATFSDWSAQVLAEEPAVLAVSMRGARHLVNDFERTLEAQGVEVWPVHYFVEALLPQFNMPVAAVKKLEQLMGRPLHDQMDTSEMKRKTRGFTSEEKGKAKRRFINRAPPLTYTKAPPRREVWFLFWRVPLFNVGAWYSQVTSVIQVWKAGSPNRTAIQYAVEPVEHADGGVVVTGIFVEGDPMRLDALYQRMRGRYSNLKRTLESAMQFIDDVEQGERDNLLPRGELLTPDERDTWAMAYRDHGTMPGRTLEVREQARDYLARPANVPGSVGEFNALGDMLYGTIGRAQVPRHHADVRALLAKKDNKALSRTMTPYVPQVEPAEGKRKERGYTEEEKGKGKRRKVESKGEEKPSVTEGNMKREVWFLLRRVPLYNVEERWSLVTSLIQEWKAGSPNRTAIQYAVEPVEHADGGVVVTGIFVEGDPMRLDALYQRMRSRYSGLRRTLESAMQFIDVVEQRERNALPLRGESMSAPVRDAWTMMYRDSGVSPAVDTVARDYLARPMNVSVSVDEFNSLWDMLYDARVRPKVERYRADVRALLAKKVNKALSTERTPYVPTEGKRKERGFTEEEKGKGKRRKVESKGKGTREVWFLMKSGLVLGPREWYELVTAQIETWKDESPDRATFKFAVETVDRADDGPVSIGVFVEGDSKQLDSLYERLHAKYLELSRTIEDALEYIDYVGTTVRARMRSRYHAGQGRRALMIEYRDNENADGTSPAVRDLARTELARPDGSISDDAFDALLEMVFDNTIERQMAMRRDDFWKMLIKYDIKVLSTKRTPYVPQVELAEGKRKERGYTEEEKGKGKRRKVEREEEGEGHRDILYRKTIAPETRNVRRAERIALLIRRWVHKKPGRRIRFKVVTEPVGEGKSLTAVILEGTRDDVAAVDSMLASAMLWFGNSHARMLAWIDFIEQTQLRDAEYPMPTTSNQQRRWQLRMVVGADGVPVDIRNKARDLLAQGTPILEDHYAGVKEDVREAITMRWQRVRDALQAIEAQRDTDDLELVEYGDDEGVTNDDDLMEVTTANHGVRVAPVPTVVVHAAMWPQFSSTGQRDADLRPATLVEDFDLRLRNWEQEEGVPFQTVYHISPFLPSAGTELYFISVRIGRPYLAAFLHFIRLIGMNVISRGQLKQTLANVSPDEVDSAWDKVKQQHKQKLTITGLVTNAD